MKVIESSENPGGNIFVMQMCLNTELVHKLNERDAFVLVHTMTSSLAFFDGLEVVGIPKATTIIEKYAFLTLAVKIISWHQTPARPRLILQVAWTLIL